MIDQQINNLLVTPGRIRSPLRGRNLPAKPRIAAQMPQSKGVIISSGAF
jgi:hypothetical protein